MARTAHGQHFLGRARVCSRGAAARVEYFHKAGYLEPRQTPATLLVALLPPRIPATPANRLKVLKERHRPLMGIGLLITSPLGSSPQLHLDA